MAYVESFAFFSYWQKNLIFLKHESNNSCILIHKGNEFYYVCIKVTSLFYCSFNDFRAQIHRAFFCDYRINRHEFWSLNFMCLEFLKNLLCHQKANTMYYWISKKIFKVTPCIIFLHEPPQIFFNYYNTIFSTCNIILSYIKHCTIIINN